MTACGTDRPTVFVRTCHALAVVSLAFGLVGCPKSGEGEKAGPSPSATTSVTTAAASAPASASAMASGSAAATAPAGQSSSFGGSYSVSPATYYISDSKEFSGVKQAKDDPSKHVGDGTMTLAIDGDGRVSGSIDSGPAAPAVIEGRMAGSQILGNVRRKETDQGLAGTIDATLSGDTVEGKLSLAEATAAIVREGKVSLKKK